MARKFTFTTQVYDKKTDFPRVGDVDVIYIDASTNKAYRYDESYYKISSADVNVWGALGSVSKGGGGASWGSITGTLSSQADLNSALNGKQDILVSGTNIKTIEGQSLLGSGDINLTASDVGLGNVDNTSDLNKPISTATQTALNAKQAALVSGINIKTINGSSVLGSGNLIISSSGLNGIHNVNGYFWQTSMGISSQVNATGPSPITMVANQIYAYPFIPNKTVTSVSLRIQVQTIGAGVNARILIYSDNNGVPNTKIYESANLDCSTVGIKTAATAQTFTAGTKYWLAVQSSGVTSLSGIVPAALMPIALQSGMSSFMIVAFINSSTFGNAPTTFFINTTHASTVPMVGIYLS